MGTVSPVGLWRINDSCSYLPVLHTEFFQIRHHIGGSGCWDWLLNKRARAIFSFLASRNTKLFIQPWPCSSHFSSLASRNTKLFIQLWPCCELDLSSSQSSIAKIYTVQTNSHDTASKAKKLSHGSHSVSVNCKKTSTNYSNTFAYFRITNNRFGARLNPTEKLFALVWNLICRAAAYQHINLKIQICVWEPINS